MKGKVKVILIIMICACFVFSLLSCKVNQTDDPIDEDLKIYTSRVYPSIYVLEQKKKDAEVFLNIIYNSNFTQEEKTLEIEAYYDASMLDVKISPYKDGDEQVKIVFNGKRSGETKVRFLVKVGFELLDCEIDYKNEMGEWNEYFSRLSLIYGGTYNLSKDYSEHGEIVYYDENMLEKDKDGKYKVIGIGETVIEFEKAKMIADCRLKDSETYETLKACFPNKKFLDRNDIENIESLKIVSGNIQDYSGLSVLKNLKKLIICDTEVSNLQFDGLATLEQINIINSKALTNLYIGNLSENVTVELSGCYAVSKVQALNIEGEFRYITDTPSSKPLGELVLYNVEKAVFDRAEVLSSLKTLQLQGVGEISNRQINGQSLQDILLDDVGCDIFVEMGSSLKYIDVTNAYFHGKFADDAVLSFEKVSFTDLKNELGNQLFYKFIECSKNVQLGGVQLENRSQSINIYPQNSSQSSTSGYINIVANRLSALSIDGKGKNFGIENLKISEANSGNKINFELKNVNGIKKVIVDDINKRFDVSLADCYDLEVIDIKGLNSLKHGALNNLTWLEVEMIGDYSYDFSQLPQLKVAIINSCKVTSLDFSNNVNLNYIEAIANANLTDLDITDCGALFAIRVRNCKLANITSNKVQMLSLERVELNDNILKNVDFLSNAPNIKVLDIANNNISGLGCLKDCVQLQELYVGGNKDLYSSSDKVNEMMSAIAKSIPLMLRLNIGTNKTQIAISTVMENVKKMTALTWVQLYSTGANAAMINQYLNLNNLPDLVFADLRYNSVSESEIKSSFNENTVLICADDFGDYKGENLGSFAHMSYTMSREDYSFVC